MSDPGHPEKPSSWPPDAGDNEEAFKQLFQAYYEDLCRFASGYVSTRAAAKNAVQDVFFNLWQRQHELEDVNIKSYLFRAVRNEALKCREREGVRARYREEQRPGDGAMSQRPEYYFRLEELDRSIQEGLASLPERRREIFLLSRQHGLTYREIADLLEISIKTVETQMSRALHFLENHLSDFL